MHHWEPYYVIWQYWLWSFQNGKTKLEIFLAINRGSKDIFFSLTVCNTVITSHSAYVAMSTELHGVKIDGFLYPNFM